MIVSESFLLFLGPLQARRRVMQPMLVRYIKAKRAVQNKGGSPEPNGVSAHLSDISPIFTVVFVIEYHAVLDTRQ